MQITSVLDSCYACVTLYTHDINLHHQSYPIKSITKLFGKRPIHLDPHVEHVYVVVQNVHQKHGT